MWRHRTYECFCLTTVFQFIAGELLINLQKRWLGFHLYVHRVVLYSNSDDWLTTTEWWSICCKRSSKSTALGTWCLSSVGCMEQVIGECLIPSSSYMSDGVKLQMYSSAKSTLECHGRVQTTCNQHRSRTSIASRRIQKALGTDSPEMRSRQCRRFILW